MLSDLLDPFTAEVMRRDRRTNPCSVGDGVCVNGSLIADHALRGLTAWLEDPSSVRWVWSMTNSVLPRLGDLSVLTTDIALSRSLLVLRRLLDVSSIFGMLLSQLWVARINWRVALVKHNGLFDHVLCLTMYSYGQIRYLAIMLILHCCDFPIEHTPNTKHSY